MTIGIAMLLWLACGIAAAVFAGQKRRSQAGWFMGGLLLGPIGILMILASKTLTEEERAACDAPTPYREATSGERLANTIVLIVVAVAVAVVALITLR